MHSRLDAGGAKRGPGILCVNGVEPEPPRLDRFQGAACSEPSNCPTATLLSKGPRRETRQFSSTTGSGSPSSPKVIHKIEFRCGGGTKLAVSKSTTGTSDSQTQIGWEVDDLQTEIDDIRARGVPIEDYDIPGLKTEDGIADVGFAWMAWIIDPGKNALAIVQYKE